MGTRRGGLAVRNPDGFTRFIHDITNTQFRSKFETDITRMHGASGIGALSDHEDQPLIIASHLGVYAIVTVGKVLNAEALTQQAFHERSVHFAELGANEINSTELVAMLINQGDTFMDGIRLAQETIVGSCSLLLLTQDGIYAARDRLGRTPVIVGEKTDARAVTLETCAFPNLENIAGFQRNNN